MEIYKKQVKPRVKTWSQEMTDEGKEWLVVFVSLGKLVFGGNYLFSEIRKSFLISEKNKNEL